MALWAQSTSSFRRSSLRSSPCLFGVPLGLVLGPFLFLIFINDLRDNIKSSVRLFADDCVLYRNIHSLQDCLILQEDLDSLGLWEADWQMKFNVDKCHSSHLGVLRRLHTKLWYALNWSMQPPFGALTALLKQTNHS